MEIMQLHPLYAVHCRWSCWMSPPAFKWLPPSSGMMGSSDFVTSIISFYSVLSVLLCTDARVSTCPLSPCEAAPPSSSHFWCPFLIFHVLFERQRPEPHSLHEMVHVRLLHRANQPQQWASCFVLGIFSDDGQCFVSFGTAANDLRAALEF